MLHYVLGITKAYTTRVGGGPFPTELYDAVDKLDPVDMARCVAAVAVMAYVVADLPQRLGDEVSTA